jgi:predicted small integral membrane protein
MSLKDSWKSLTPKEKVFLGAILVLLIAITAKWEKISKEMGKGFDNLFGTHHS